jgi:predicted permease
VSWLKSLETRARLILARRAAESRMEEELRLHLEMEAERLTREKGLAPAEARRVARVRFGGQDAYRESMREGRGLAWFSGLRLDLKLGLRMLLKYPVLTLASVVALMIAVALATSWFEFMSDLASPRVPLEEARRLVEVENRDLAGGADEFRSLHDFETWRDEAESLVELSVASPVTFNVTTEDGRYVTLRGARVTPSMFGLTRVRPLLGRTLTEADLDPSAAPVAVLGYDAWQRLFDGDRTAVGRTIRLGTDYATVVGVMPEGYAFPVIQEVWTPLRERAVSYARREGPHLEMYARLAPGFSLSEAQAELDVIGKRAAAAFPETNAQLRPAVMRFGSANDMAGIAVLLNLPFVLFLIVVSANVATLLFARTATRESEIALRLALGASRRRVILQLIAEAFVLTSPAAALGLAVASWGLRWGMKLFWEVQQQRPPFYFDAGLSPTTPLYVAALAVIGAVIIGAIPGIRATRQQLRERIGQPGSSGMKFGRLATGVIMVQVALCVGFIPVAIMNGTALLPEKRPTDFPATRYLSGRLTRQLDQPAAARDSVAADLFNEVVHRIVEQPGVLAVTRASRLPGFNHPGDEVEIDDNPSRILAARRVVIDPNFFDVMEARIVAGRGFNAGDVTSTGRIVIVDEAWAQLAFPGRNPIGQRIRYPGDAAEQQAPWFEIVGVVAGMDRAIGPGTSVAAYHPLRRDQRTAVQIYVKTAGPPAELVPQVHNIVAGVDPSLGVADLMPLDEIWRPVLRSDAYFAAALAVVSAIIVLFALMGIYALMSFTVAQRSREIGIRAALGANPQRILMAIFSRAMFQIGLGIIGGGALISLTVARDPQEIRLVGGVAAAMVVVGLIGCLLPALRALRIQPIDALRVD